MTTDTLIAEALETAVAIAWDGCHKIYVLMDDEQFSLMRSYGYGDIDGGSYLMAVQQDAGGRRDAEVTLRDWWDESCGLRFINTVRTVSGDPNEGFADIIAQCEEWVS